MHILHFRQTNRQSSVLHTSVEWIISCAMFVCRYIPSIITNYFNSFRIYLYTNIMALYYIFFFSSIFIFYEFNESLKNLVSSEF